MSKPKQLPKLDTPFAQALAARKGEVAPETLTNAARHLYRDNSLANATLEHYAAKHSPHTAKDGLKHLNPTFKPC